MYFVQSTLPVRYIICKALEVLLHRYRKLFSGVNGTIKKNVHFIILNLPYFFSAWFGTRMIGKVRSEYRMIGPGWSSTLQFIQAYGRYVNSGTVFDLCNLNDQHIRRAWTDLTAEATSNRARTHVGWGEVKPQICIFAWRDRFTALCLFKETSPQERLIITSDNFKLSGFFKLSNISHKPFILWNTIPVRCAENLYELFFQPIKVFRIRIRLDPPPPPHIADTVQV
jgi:hypothetical protein